MMRAVGEMPEWPNGTDSKSVVPSPVPRVRIPISPPYLYEKALIIQGFFVSVFLKKSRPITLDGAVFFDQGLMSVAAYAELIQSPRCH